MTTDGDLHRIALAMETMRGAMDTGFATVRGDINVLATRETSALRRLDEVEKDVEALKDRRFPLPTIGGLMGVAGVCISVAVAFQKG